MSARWPGASLYPATIEHRRLVPLAHSFRYHSYYWSVDLDHVPTAPWPLRALVRFESADHGGDPAPCLRANVDRYLADHGVDLDGGTVRMLCHARVLGHVFNPVTFYWCRGPTARLECVIVEVHNTYGQRHRYLVRPDERGGAVTGKRLYVSPYHPVDGWYSMRLPEPDDLLRLAVRLHRPDGSTFVATVHGRRCDATLWSLLGLFARHPVTPLLGSARIRYQGTLLRLRGLRPFPRPRPPTGEST